MSVAAFALQQQPFPLQHDHWLRPPAGPGAAVAAAASAYSRPAAGVPYVQPATPSAHALQAAANEEWIQEQRLCQTALAVACLVFRDEDEDEECRADHGARNLTVQADAAAAGDGPIPEKRLKCMTRRAYYKRRRKARMAAHFVLESILAGVDKAIEARSPSSQAAAAAEAPAAAVAVASPSQQEQP